MAASLLLAAFCGAATLAAAASVDSGRAAKSPAAALLRAESSETAADRQAPKVRGGPPPILRNDSGRNYSVEVIHHWLQVKSESAAKGHALRCLKDVVDIEAGNTISKCQELAYNPPPETGLSPADVRYFQFCPQCKGIRCQLVQYCLDIDQESEESKGWTLWVDNEKEATLAWPAAAFQMTCELPSFLGDNAPYVRSRPLKEARGVTHKRACQEWATKENKHYFTFCDSCILGSKCVLHDQCLSCTTMTSVEMVVYVKAEDRPPCSRGR